MNKVSTPSISSVDTSQDNYSSQFPQQKLPRKLKDQQWREQCVDSVIHNCNVYTYNRRTPYLQRKRNYDVFNNRIGDLNFDYVTTPFKFPTEQGVEYKMPASIQPLDILSPNFMLLIGEEGKRMFSPIVRAMNADSTKAKDVIKKDLILKTLQEHITSYIQQNPQSEEELTKQLKKYSTYSPKDLCESQAQHLITYLMKHEHLDKTFMDGWKGFLIAGEEVYNIDEVNKAGKLRRVNDLELHYVLPNNSDMIDEATKIYERNRMTVPEIIDEFYELLTPDQITDLERHQYGQGTMYDYNTPLSLSMMNVGVNGAVSGDGLPINSGIGGPVSFSDFMSGDVRPGIDIHRATWASMRKVGILHYIDKDNVEQLLPVDEIFKVDKEDPTQFIEWFWVKEYWYGIRIGADMYLKIEPKKHQFRSIDSLSECKSGYVGTVASALNSVNVSLMDRVIPWLFYYLTVWYRTELLLAKNHGKLVNLDLSLFPDSMGPEKVMYFATALGFRFVDGYSESNKGARRNQWNMSTHDGKVIDMDTSQAIQHNITLLTFLEQKIEDTCGVSRQRKGQLTPTDAVGTTERAVVQSSYITEPYFNTHNYTKLRALDCLLKVTQECIQDGEKTYSYITDDMQEVYGTINGSEFSIADFETFLSNSPKDQEIIEVMKREITNGLQNDKLNFSQIADIIGSESIADLKNRIIQAEQETLANKQQEQQQQLQEQQQIHQEQMDIENRKLDLEEYKINLDNQTKLEIAQMTALAIDEGANAPEIDNTAEIGLKAQEIAQSHFIEQQKLQHEKDRASKELDLKNKEIEGKKEVERLKLKQVDHQNKSQEKMQNKQAQMEDKMNAAKIATEKAKARAVIIKARQKPPTKK